MEDLVKRLCAPTSPNDAFFIGQWPGEKPERYDALRMEAATRIVELEKKLGAMDAIAEFLFGLLDDIDTADDIAKANDELYRSMIRSRCQRRFVVASTDGYSVEFKTKDLEDWKGNDE